MARYLSFISGCLLTLLAMAAEAQTVRPAMPGQRQPAQGNPPASLQQAPPSTNGVPAQPAVQQPASRPPDNLSNTPPSPPTVTYRDGLLTVQAQNSTLGAVLSAIRSKTGIEFDGWENSPDRVVLSQGPAPAGEVLAAIFTGSKFDFVAVGRPDNPSIVQRVIMTPKSGPGSTANAQQPRPPQNAGQEGDDEDNSDDQANNGGDPQDTPVQPIQTPQATAQPQNQQPTQPKTPEQLLQELQEMKKQQEQQQQGITPNPAQVPRKQPPQ